MAARSLLRTLALLALPPIGVRYSFEPLIRRNVFQTGPFVQGIPEATGVPFERVPFWTADGLELEGWLFEGGGLPATVLFMHGTNYNASDMWATEDIAQLFGEFVRGLGCRLFVFDYRGYGQNHGEPTELGTYLDAAAALACLHQREEIDPLRIVFYGFSLGTGIAVELALHEPNAGLVLRAPYTSVRDMILERAPRLRTPLALAPWLPRTRYDSAAKIPHLPVPLLVMHGDEDETVPYRMGQRLYELAPEPKRFVTLTGAAHRDISLEIMIPAVRQFLEEVAGD